MFGQFSSLELDLGFVVRSLLVIFATLVLAPAALILMGAFAFVISPVAIVGIPFIVPALFPGASRERSDAVLRASMPPLRAPAFAH